MAYKIVYGEVQQPAKKDMTIAVFALFFAILFGCAISPKARTKIFPWTREYAVEAFSDFQNDLQAGATFEAAFLAYCRDIVANGMEEN